MATADTVTRRRDVSEVTDVNLNTDRVRVGIRVSVRDGRIVHGVKGVRVSASVYCNAKNAKMKPVENKLCNRPCHTSVGME